MNGLDLRKLVISQSRQNAPANHAAIKFIRCRRKCFAYGFQILGDKSGKCEVLLCADQPAFALLLKQQRLPLCLFFRLSGCHVGAGFPRHFVRFQLVSLAVVATADTNAVGDHLAGFILPFRDVGHRLPPPVRCRNHRT